jgi:hypothetical protein
MKRTSHALANLLLMAAATTAGCGTEKIETDVAYLTDGNAATTTSEAWATFVFAPDSSFKLRRLSIRVDGKWLLTSPDDPRPVTVEPEGNYGRRVDALVGAPHILQLIGDDGDVLLTTSAVQFTAGRNNQVIFYGGKDDLDYYFFANSDAELATVSDGMVLARSVNLIGDRLGVPLRTCPASVGSVDKLDLSVCTVVDASFQYGELWQAVVPRDTSLAIPCDPTTPDAICYLSKLGPSCRVSTPTSPTVPAKTSFQGLTRRGQGVFESYDLPAPIDCGSP